MPYRFRDYVLECVREAPLAWRKGAIAMTIIINLVIFGIIYLGWHLQAYPTTYFLIGTGVIALLDVLIIFPFKLWRANKVEIAALKGKYAGARKELWNLREQGVGIRNDGLTTGMVAPWSKKFEDWHAKVLEQAAILSMDLRHSLDPIDKISPNNNEVVAVTNPQHQKKVSVMSEMLSRLYEFLNRTAV
jgi:hypothetical protein